MIVRLALIALAASASAAVTPQLPFSAPAAPPNQHTLTLKHAIHLSHTHRDRPALHRIFSDDDRLSIESAEGHANTQTVSTVRTKAWRPSSQRAYQAARRASFYTPRALRAGRPLSLDEAQDSLWGSTLDWHEDDIEMPNVTDVATLLSLAKLTSNAYSAPDKDWFDLEGKWNVVRDIVQHRSERIADPRASAPSLSLSPPPPPPDALRPRSPTRLAGSRMAFEATSLPTRQTVRSSSPSRAPRRPSSAATARPATTTRRTCAALLRGRALVARIWADCQANFAPLVKQDNLLFSCCCARVDWSWSTVCDCYSGTYTCNQGCIEEAVMSESAYYPVATVRFVFAPHHVPPLRH